MTRSDRECRKCGGTIPANEDFCPRCTGNYKTPKPAKKLTAKQQARRRIVRRLLFMGTFAVSFLVVVYLSGTSEYVNRPGSEIRVNVTEIRSLRSTLLLGLKPLWNPVEIAFTANTVVANDGSAIGWQPAEVKTDSRSGGINLSLPIDRGNGGNPIFRQVPVDIIFPLIDDDRLAGRTLTGKVELSLRVAKVDGDPRVVNIVEDVKFRVLSESEIEAYDSAWFARGMENIFRVAAITGVLLLILIIANALMPRYND